jgi:hypothetical protein
MKVSLESTSKLVTINGVLCRVYEGKTDGGIAITAFMTYLEPVNPADQPALGDESLNPPHRAPSDKNAKLPAERSI